MTDKVGIGDRSYECVGKFPCLGDVRVEEVVQKLEYTDALRESEVNGRNSKSCSLY